MDVEARVWGSALRTEAERARVLQYDGAFGTLAAVVVRGGEAQAPHPVLPPSLPQQLLDLRVHEAVQHRHEHALGEEGGGWYGYDDDDDGDVLVVGDSEMIVREDKAPILVNFS